jgi:hypothetical protein
LGAWPFLSKYDLVQCRMGKRREFHEIIHSTNYNDKWTALKITWQKVMAQMASYFTVSNPKVSPEAPTPKREFFQRRWGPHSSCGYLSSCLVGLFTGFPHGGRKWVLEKGQKWCVTHSAAGDSMRQSSVTLCRSFKNLFFFFWLKTCNLF